MLGPRACEPYDVVGIGFGPANLSLALALHEGGAPDTGVSAVFLERQPSFGWHRGMLIEEGKMQVSFLKDLVTPRDPCSRHSFVSYLHEHNRLIDFINLQTFCPSRHEFHDYLAWCARSVESLVRYGHCVTSLAPIRELDGSVTAWEVSARSSTPGAEQFVVHAKTVAFAPGLVPRLPRGVVAEKERIWHTADMVYRLQGLEPRAGARFVVIGGGQSAAEAIAHLHRSFRDVEVVGVMSKYGFTPSDDTPFVNGVFNPEVVGEFYDATPALRESILSSHANTNYGVVDPPLITELYERWYHERVCGRQRLSFERNSQFEDVHVDESGLRVVLSTVGTNVRKVIAADYLVCATGYEPISLDTVASSELRALIDRDEQGGTRIGRDYRLAMRPEVKAPIFVQGSDATHGLGSTLISNLAVRAGELADAILAEQQRAVARGESWRTVREPAA